MGDFARSPIWGWAWWRGFEVLWCVCVDAAMRDREPREALL